MFIHKLQKYNTFPDVNILVTGWISKCHGPYASYIHWLERVKLIEFTTPEQRKAARLQLLNNMIEALEKA